VTVNRLSGAIRFSGKVPWHDFHVGTNTPYTHSIVPQRNYQASHRFWSRGDKGSWAESDSSSVLSRPLLRLLRRCKNQTIWIRNSKFQFDNIVSSRRRLRTWIIDCPSQLSITCGLSEFHAFKECSPDADLKLRCSVQTKLREDELGSWRVLFWIFKVIFNPFNFLLHVILGFRIFGSMLWRKGVLAFQ